MSNRLKTRRTWISVAAGAGALVVAAATAGGPGRRLDRRLYRATNGVGPLPRRADPFFEGVTELGSIWAAAGAAAAVASFGRRREALDALGAAGLMWLVGQGLKKVVRRPRPYDSLPEVRLLILKPRGTSWPSSHPAVLAAFLVVLTRDLSASRPVKAGGASLTGLVAVSRVALGVHFPSDVVGGVLLGLGLADVWSLAMSRTVLGRPYSVPSPGTVSG